MEALFKKFSSSFSGIKIQVGMKGEEDGKGKKKQDGRHQEIIPQAVKAVGTVTKVVQTPQTWRKHSLFKFALIGVLVYLSFPSVSPVTHLDL